MQWVISLPGEGSPSGTQH